MGGMMNIVMGQILRKFREHNGRGPDTKELLQMRQALAMKLGVEVPPLSDDEVSQCEDSEDKENTTDDQTAVQHAQKKRSADDAFEENKNAGNSEGDDNPDIDERKGKKVRWSMTPEDEDN